MGYSYARKKEGANEIFQDYQACFQSSLPLSTSQNQHPKRLKIGEWLVSERWITPDQLSVALKEQTRRSKRLGELILDLGFISLPNTGLIPCPPDSSSFSRTTSDDPFPAR
ncbi:MAG: hypothetical protein K0R76_972 [Alphaproteobacteria bacterium]|nr:hypothetical protein [Alphaproteobacteria bacterium]